MLAALPAQADDLGSAINNARGSALPIDQFVDEFAQRAAERSAGRRSLAHSDLSPLLGYCLTAGEVIGYGSDVGTIMAAFAGSPSHWKVITQGQWTVMGTGAAVDGAGVLWVAVAFCTASGGPAPPPPPPPSSAPTPLPPPTPAPQAPIASAFLEPVPLTDVLAIGPILDLEGTVSLLLGASPFLPPEEWRRFIDPSIS
ncbi:MAG: hypothetical protein ACT4OP_07005 [Actinomycetota bacterium]